jgi:hypothetical protein
MDRDGSQPPAHDRARVPAAVRPGRGTLSARPVPWRAGLLLFVTCLVLGLAASLGPIPQDRAYHDFADQRTLLGIPNFWNVVSNVPFAIAGLLGLLVLASGRRPGALPDLLPSYVAFFAGSVLIAAGSAWYHLSPSNATLVWDRLPMTVSFVAFFTIVLGEHVSVRLARWLLGPLIVLGAASVGYWALSERLGREDLRPYLLVQAVAIVLTPLVLALYPSRLTNVRLVWGTMACYGLAMIAEALDRPIHSALGLMSGHTLKHLFAAAAVVLLAVALRARRPVLLSSRETPPEEKACS